MVNSDTKVTKRLRLLLEKYCADKVLSSLVTQMEHVHNTINISVRAARSFISYNYLICYRFRQGCQLVGDVLVALTWRCCLPPLSPDGRVYLSIIINSFRCPSKSNKIYCIFRLFAMTKFVVT